MGQFFTPYYAMKSQRLHIYRTYSNIICHEALEKNKNICIWLDNIHSALCRKWGNKQIYCPKLAMFWKLMNLVFLLLQHMGSNEIIWAERWTKIYMSVYIILSPLLIKHTVCSRTCITVKRNINITITWFLEGVDIND